MSSTHRRLRVRAAALSVLAAACGSGSSDVAAGNPEPILREDVSLEIPLAPPSTLDIPIRPPADLEGVEIEILPEQPCTLEATVENDALGFEYDSSIISNDGAQLGRDFIMRTLDANPGRQPERIDLRGHASSEGGEVYNRSLSQGRADAVRLLLESMPELRGVKVTAAGLGEADPIADNESADGRRRNRRVEIQIAFSGCT